MEGRVAGASLEVDARMVGEKKEAVPSPGRGDFWMEGLFESIPSTIIYLDIDARDLNAIDVGDLTWSESMTSVSEGCCIKQR